MIKKNTLWVQIGALGTFQVHDLADCGLNRFLITQVMKKAVLWKSFIFVFKQYGIRKRLESNRDFCSTKFDSRPFGNKLIYTLIISNWIYQAIFEKDGYEQGSALVRALGPRVWVGILYRIGSKSHLIEKLIILLFLSIWYPHWKFQPGILGLWIVNNYYNDFYNNYYIIFYNNYYIKVYYIILLI